MKYDHNFTKHAKILPYMTDAAFWSNVQIGSPDACWPWLGRLSNSGHGEFKGHATAHRRAFEAANGPVPAGLEVCHGCHDAACVNPRHLRADTHKANQIEMGARRRGKPLKVLTEAIVRAAKLMRAAGRKICEIAAEFKVRADTLGKALLGKTWQWVVC